MNILEEAIEAIHGAICEESLEDHMDPMWPGRCVKAAKAAAPLIAAQALREAAEVWGDSTWQDVWAEDDVDDDVTAVQSTVKWIKARADKLEATP